MNQTALGLGTHADSRVTVVTGMFHTVPAVYTGIKQNLNLVSKVMLGADNMPKVRNRVHWIHPINIEAKAEERFRKFSDNIRNFEIKFFGYYRMSMKSFDEYCRHIK